MAKALGLLSGGLDSSLAAMALKRQGVDVTCICFSTPFFGADKARLAAKQMDIPLLVHDISDIHLDMVKAPTYGYGKNMNPCVDCHAMMFRLAGEVMEKEGFDFLFSGEVLGQRPLSQNPGALRSVANHSGHPDKILRPLCAKHLPITPMEEAGIVDREQLLDIQGRSRRAQQEYAKAWGLTDYPASGGGCLLTEVAFSNRLRDLFDQNPEATSNDVRLLKSGRQFRLGDTSRLCLGRNQEDNDQLESLAEGHHLLLKALDFNGPLGVYSGDTDGDELKKACALVASYCKGKDEKLVQIEVVRARSEKVEESDGGTWIIEVEPLDRDKAKECMIA